MKTDSRGRILLPEKFRETPLFEIEENSNGMLSLIPMRAVPVEHKKSKWVNKEVTRYLKKNVFKRIGLFLKNQDEVQSIILFGSRAREEALTNSDFDIALILKKFPNFKKRNQIREKLELTLKEEINELNQHGVSGEFSCTFLEQDPSEWPPIYLTVAQEGILIGDKSKTWPRFKDKIIRECLYEIKGSADKKNFIRKKRG